MWPGCQYFKPYQAELSNGNLSVARPPNYTLKLMGFQRDFTVNQFRQDCLDSRFHEYGESYRSLHLVVPGDVNIVFDEGIMAEFLGEE